MKVLIVVDMQNDFIDGALGTAEAQAIVPKVEQKLKDFDGTVIFTRDTHFDDYLSTQEGRNLPVPHCLYQSDGWQIRDELQPYMGDIVIDKLTFGSDELGLLLSELNDEAPIESIEFVGLCTDICVISNVMIAKAFLPEVPLLVDASCCAGVSPETHHNALEAMKVCQVQVINE